MAGGIIGRDKELAAVDEFLARALTGPGVLLLDGEAGAGKTTLWNAAVANATRRGFRVLSCRPRQRRRSCRSAASMTCSMGFSGRWQIRCRSCNVRRSTPCCCAGRERVRRTRGRCAGRCWRPCGCSPVVGRSCWRLTTCSGSIGRALRCSSMWCVGSATTWSRWCLRGGRRRRMRCRSGWLGCRGPGVCGVFRSARSALARSTCWCSRSLSCRCRGRSWFGFTRPRAATRSTRWRSPVPWLRRVGGWQRTSRCRSRRR